MTVQLCPSVAQLRLTEALPLPGPDGPSKLTFRPSRLVRSTSRASRKVWQRRIRYAALAGHGWTCSGRRDE